MFHSGLASIILSNGLLIYDPPPHPPPHPTPPHEQTLACGLLGIPPVNGVLPQAPMHTRSLATLQKSVTQASLKKGKTRCCGCCRLDRGTFV